MPDTTSDTAIRLNDLSFTWPGRTGFTLNIPDLSVAKGEKVFLLGDSGSGKSTLLGLIAGIMRPGRGEVRIGGTDLAQLGGPARDRFRADHIGVIFQMFNLLPYATALENILLPLSFARLRRDALPDPKAEALRLTAALGLDPGMVVRARASELSIGQQQRVAAARALIGGPDLVIADEPTSALDATAQAAFVDLLMDQVDAAGATLMMVSHDSRLANRFDRVLNLADLVQQETAAA